MLEFHRSMIRLHRNYEVTRKGSLTFLWNDYQGLSYGRFTQNESLIVILNNQPEERAVEIEGWRAGVSRRKDTMMERIMLSDITGFTEEKAYYKAKAGIIRFTMPGYGVVILYSSEQD